MKIISKVKDYYDFMQGIYGIDEKLVLDRRFESIEKPSLDCCGTPHIYTFSICNNQYTVVQFLDKFYHTLDELKVLAKLIKKRTGNTLTIQKYRYNIYCIETHSRQQRFNSEKTLDKKNWEFLNQKDTGQNTLLREPILLRKSSASGPIWTPNVILQDFGFASWIPPEEIFLKISAFLAYMVDHPPIPDKQTNAGKIQSHGFDLKRSFRPKMKK